MAESELDWRLDETAHAGPEHLDPAYVAGYETKAGYDPTPDVAALVAHGIGPGSLVIELAAGTGAFARAIAPHAGRVVALDVSPAMVAELQRRVAESGAENVEVVGFEPAETEARIADWMAGAVRDPARGYTAGEYAAHVRTEHSTFRWLFEPMLDHAGFDVLDVEYRAGFYGAYTCRRRG